MDKVTEKVSQCLVEAGSTFREDQKAAYRRAISAETHAGSCWVMQQVLDNALVAEQQHSPLCDDTGIPHLFLEVGPHRQVSGELIDRIHEGIADGLRRLPGRPMAIMGDDMQRIDQSG
ncbi:MAG: fumarate hydratase, partial [Paludibacteraceae bacterium]|nr:fumarate hydratase [Paludibacteraceae bacterium]